MVESGSSFIERFRPVRIGELVDTDESLAAKEPNHVMKWPGIFIDDGLSSEEVLVLGTAPTKVCDG